MNSNKKMGRGDINEKKNDFMCNITTFIINVSNLLFLWNFLLLFYKF